MNHDQSDWAWMVESDLCEEQGDLLRAQKIRSHLPLEDDNSLQWHYE